MSRVCDNCGKGPATGNMVSHSNRRCRRRWLPNLQKIKVMVDGTPHTMKVCTRCLRTFRSAMMEH